MAGTQTAKGVLVINGKQVEDTFNGLRKTVASLERDMKKLTIGSDEYIEKAQDLKKVSARFEEVRKEIAETKKTAAESGKSLSGFFDDTGSSIKKLGNDVLSGQVSFKTLGTTIKTFAVESWAAIGSIPIIGWVAAAVGALGLAVREIYQYNTQLYEANKLTSDITKLQGEALDKMTVKTQTLEQILGLDRKEQLEAAKNLVQNFGITYEQAMQEIENGAIRGGNANGEFLDSLKEYPAFFAKAGYSVKDFVNIVNAGFNLGIYSDKLPDALKEFDLSMREQTKSTREALVNAFGATFADDVLQRVSAGKTTVKDALIEINKESEKYNLTQKQQAQLTADIFRGAGEDVGGFARIMDVVTVALIDQGGVLTEQQQTVKDQIDAYNDLGEAKLDALKSDAFYAFKKDIENIWVGIQKLWYVFVAELRNAINGIRLGFLNIRDFSAILPAAIGGVFRAIGADFLNLGKIITTVGQMFKNAFSLDWSAAEASFEKLKGQLSNAFNNTKKAVTDIKNAAASINDKNYNAIVGSDAAKASAQRIIEKRRENAGKSGNNFDGSETPGKSGGKSKNTKDNSDKEAAERKRALEQIEKDEEESHKKLLDLQQQYQDSKTKLIEDEFQKETQAEVDRRNKESAKTLTEIADLEKKKLDTKSVVAKAEFQKSIDLLHQIEIQNEEAHRKNMLAIQQKWDAQLFENFVKNEQQKIDRERTEREKQINDITTLEEAKRQIAGMEHLKLSDQELEGIKTLEDAKNALREDANREALQKIREQVESQIAELNNALKDSGISEEAKKKLNEDLDTLKAKLEGIRGQQGANASEDAKKVEESKDAGKSKVDILGYTALEWETAWENLDKAKDKIGAYQQFAQMAFSSLSTAVSAYYQLQQNLADREMKKQEKNNTKKKKDLLKQLNEGFITNEEYHLQLRKMEAETANKKAEIAYKQAKTERALKIVEIITNTSLAIMQAYAQLGPIGGTIAAVLIGTLGAIQLGTVMSTPLPEKPSFAAGGFTPDIPGSADETGEVPVGYYKLHRKEWVAPRWMRENPRTANVINWLENIRQGGPGKTNSFADGGSVETTTEPKNTPVPTSVSGDPQMLYVLSQLSEFLEYLKINGVDAWLVADAETGKQAKKAIKEFEKYENRASGK